jgi:hypothetical protein
MKDTQRLKERQTSKHEYMISLKRPTVNPKRLKEVPLRWKRKEAQEFGVANLLGAVVVLVEHFDELATPIELIDDFVGASRVHDVWRELRCLLPNPTHPLAPNQTAAVKEGNSPSRRQPLARGARVGLLRE